jgi:indolepyruvate ferredoxin oxidoreductase
VFLTGSQALARLPVEQLRADRAAGMRTAAFVSGYPGSPLAGFDRDVASAAAFAKTEGLELIFRPGLNEELAATAVMGSQLASTIGTSKYDGVIGLWYGKGPGLDRASDAMRHATFAGTSARGGAIALVGDDPKAKSSTLPSSSDATMVDLHMPILYPGDVQEALDLGRHAIALSRCSGLWVGLKVVDAVADGTGTVDIHPDRVLPISCTIEVDGVPFVPRPSGKLLTPYTLDMEREFQEVRLRIADDYGSTNAINTISVRGPNDWIGLVACGHTYLEMIEALSTLGLRTNDDLRAAGIRLLRVNMPVPIDTSLVRRFAEGLHEVMVIEEKNATLELLIKDALYSQADRPTISARRAPDGSVLVPRTGTLDADVIAPVLRARLSERLGDRLAPPPPPARQLIPLSVTRTPYFCSGCPHNTSTKAPDGALIGGGIGCHSMVMLMEPDRVGDIVGLTAMGNEGAQWIGMSPFVDTPHLIQNLGDGTLFHSGILAVRAAAASGVNITYKVLYNGAVAMTGGQDPNGQLSVPQLVRALLAEGVVRVMITTDDLARYRDVDLPDGVDVWGRQRIIEAQEVLAAVPGCTVLIHDQRCAAEQRRDRKRGKIERPGFSVLINERVCEGCGDCGDVSNCLSVQPVDTSFGRKTRIDQSSCNMDLSCMDGDCPSFATVRPARRNRRRRRPGQTATERRGAAPPTGEPGRADVPRTVRMSGIGGTGVVTTSQILGTAAMLDGLHVRGLDQTGLSQKAGTVVSDLRFTADEPGASNKATASSVDVLLAFDQLSATSDALITASDPGRTVAVVNTARVPTGTMVAHPDRAFPMEQVRSRLHGATQRQVECDAGALVRGLFGDDAMTNVFVLGVAVQSGLLPVKVASLEAAIELNGVTVERNLDALRWGRAWVMDPDAVSAAAGIELAPAGEGPLVERLTADLAAYQSARYARRFTDVIARAQSTGDREFADAVAIHLHKLMAYKDEYEVARLLLLPESRAQAEALAGPGARVEWRLHPPLLRAMGLQRKLRLGRWATPLLVALRAMRRLRGTPLDVFGMAGLRRTERKMIDEYVAAIGVIVDRWSRVDRDEALVIVRLPDKVRGYEHLKQERASRYRAELGSRLAKLSG